ncbi:hypothetical protein [Enterococcus gallinarum]|nr:hypothetical protein [Enterococcus gallinarum]
MALLALVEETKEKMRLKKSAKNGSLIKNRVVLKNYPEKFSKKPP